MILFKVTVPSLLLGLPPVSGSLPVSFQTLNPVPFSVPLLICFADYSKGLTQVRPGSSGCSPQLPMSLRQDYSGCTVNAGHLEQFGEPCLKIKSAKNTGDVAQCPSSCLACMRPWIQPPAPKEQKLTYSNSPAGPRMATKPLCFTSALQLHSHISCSQPWLSSVLQSTAVSVASSDSLQPPNPTPSVTDQVLPPEGKSHTYSSLYSYTFH